MGTAQWVVADEIQRVRRVRIRADPPSDVTPFFMTVREVVREALTGEAARGFPFDPRADDTAARLYVRRQIRLSLAALLAVASDQPTLTADDVELLYEGDGDDADRPSSPPAAAAPATRQATPAAPRPLVLSREGAEWYVYRGDGPDLSPAVQWEPWEAFERRLGNPQASQVPRLTPRELLMVARDRERAAAAVAAHGGEPGEGDVWFAGLFTLAAAADVLVHAVRTQARKDGSRAACYYAAPLPLPWLGRLCP